MTGRINAVDIDVNGTRLWFDVDGPARSYRTEARCGSGRRWCWFTAVRGSMTTRTSSRTSAGSRSMPRLSTSICVGTDGRTGATQARGASKHAQTTSGSSATRSQSSDRSSSDTRWADRSSCCTVRATPDMRLGSLSSRDLRGGTSRGWSRGSAASRATRSRRSRGAATPASQCTTRNGLASFRLRPTPAG
jgi:hypothetical protein